MGQNNAIKLYHYYLRKRRVKNRSGIFFFFPFGKDMTIIVVFDKNSFPKLHCFFKFEPTYLSTYQHLFLATVLPTTHCKEKQTAIVLWSQFSYLLLLLFQIDATIIFSECWTQLWDFSILYSWYASPGDRFFLLTRTHKNLHLSPKAYTTFWEIQPDILLPGIKSLFV